jgi:hypothetical protein
MSFFPRREFDDFAREGQEAPASDVASKTVDVGTALFPQPFAVAVAVFKLGRAVWKARHASDTAQAGERPQPLDPDIAAERGLQADIANERMTDHDLANVRAATQELDDARRELTQDADERRAIDVRRAERLDETGAAAQRELHRGMDERASFRREEQLGSHPDRPDSDSQRLRVDSAAAREQAESRHTSRVEEIRQDRDFGQRADEGAAERGASRSWRPGAHRSAEAAEARQQPSPQVPVSAEMRREARSEQLKRDAPRWSDDTDPRPWESRREETDLRVAREIYRDIGQQLSYERQVEADFQTERDMERVADRQLAATTTDPQILAHLDARKAQRGKEEQAMLKREEERQNVGRPADEHANRMTSPAGTQLPADLRRQAETDRTKEWHDSQTRLEATGHHPPDPGPPGPSPSPPPSPPASASISATAPPPGEETPQQSHHGQDAGPHGQPEASEPVSAEMRREARSEQLKRDAPRWSDDTDPRPWESRREETDLRVAREIYRDIGQQLSYERQVEADFQTERDMERVADRQLAATTTDPQILAHLDARKAQRGKEEQAMLKREEERQNVGRPADEHANRMTSPAGTQLPADLRRQAETDRTKEWHDSQTRLEATGHHPPDPGPPGPSPSPPPSPPASASISATAPPPGEETTQQVESAEQELRAEQVEQDLAQPISTSAAETPRAQEAPEDAVNADPAANPASAPVSTSAVQGATDQSALRADTVTTDETDTVTTDETDTVSTDETDTVATDEADTVTEDEPSQAPAPEEDPETH